MPRRSQEDIEFLYRQLPRGVGLAVSDEGYKRFIEIEHVGGDSAEAQVSLISALDKLDHNRLTCPCGHPYWCHLQSGCTDEYTTQCPCKQPWIYVV